MDGHAQGRGGGAPPAGADEHDMPAFKGGIQFSDGPGNGVFLLLGQFLIGGCVDENNVVKGQADIAAHEMAILPEKAVCV